MVFIKETGFGYIVVDDTRYTWDIVICRDNVFRRPKEFSKKYRDIYRHTPLSLEEIKYLLRKCSDVKIVVIGSGQYGSLPIPREVVEYLSSNGLEVLIDRTPRVIEFLNKLSSRNTGFLAVLHVTC